MRRNNGRKEMHIAKMIFIHSAKKYLLSRDASQMCNKIEKKRVRGYRIIIFLYFCSRCHTNCLHSNAQIKITSIYKIYELMEIIITIKITKICFCCAFDSACVCKNAAMALHVNNRWREWRQSERKIERWQIRANQW